MNIHAQNPLEYTCQQEQRMEFTLPEPLVEMLLQQAAYREIPVEEIVMQSIRNYMERSENRGG